MATTRGRPKNVFGLPPDDFNRWRMSRSWGTHTLDEHLDAGNAVGAHLVKMDARIEFTQTSFCQTAFWVRHQAGDGTRFHPPTPVAREDIPALLERWGCRDFTWADGDEVVRAHYVGALPRELVLSPGPYWYVTFRDERYQLHFDKLASTARRHDLAILIGSLVNDLGDIPCDKLPMLDTMLTAQDAHATLVAAYAGATKHFRRQYLRGDWRPTQKEKALW